ncbi:hypothetical protein AMR42_03695, partial [Limnothrix sp. PR1529]
FITFPQDMPSATPMPEIEAFIARWSGTAQAERANYARFLDELCPIIEVPKPDPATGASGDYRSRGAHASPHAGEACPSVRQCRGRQRRAPRRLKVVHVRRQTYQIQSNDLGERFRRVM